ncbi:MAG: hypothetical protein LBJ10_04550 [Clostridiales bacterium]|nr:hypothetical protein [Clostridiales bacterium]
MSKALKQALIDKYGSRCFIYSEAMNEKLLYEHIAGNRQRVIAIMFTGDEIKDYNRLIEAVGIDGAKSIVKELVHEYLK